jgi:hypothetical protein
MCSRFTAARASVQGSEVAEDAHDLILLIEQPVAGLEQLFQGRSGSAFRRWPG